MYGNTKRNCNKLMHESGGHNGIPFLMAIFVFSLHHYVPNDSEAFRFGTSGEVLEECFAICVPLLLDMKLFLCLTICPHSIRITVRRAMSGLQDWVCSWVSIQCCYRHLCYIGSEVLTAIDMNVAISWDMVLCSPYVSRRFGIYNLHLQGR
jgi:hypothetical protein